MRADTAFESIQGCPPSPIVAIGDAICHATGGQEWLASSSITLDDEASRDSEVPDGIYDVIIAAFRGQPDLLPEVHAILSTGSESYRTFAAGRKRTSSERTCLDTSQTPAKSPKRCRATDGHSGTPEDEDSSKVETGTTDEKNEILPHLKFACAYHKLYPAMYCTQASISGTGDFYQSCSGSGWGKAQHLL